MERYSSGLLSLSLSWVGSITAKLIDARLICVLGEEPPLADGYIEPSKPAHEVRQEPYPLPKEFEWSTVDITDDVQVSSTPIICLFLNAHFLLATRIVRTSICKLCRGRRRFVPIPILSRVLAMVCGTTACCCNHLIFVFPGR